MRGAAVRSSNTKVCGEMRDATRMSGAAEMRGITRMSSNAEMSDATGISSAKIRG